MPQGRRRSTTIVVKIPGTQVARSRGSRQGRHNPQDARCRSGARAPSDESSRSLSSQRLSPSSSPIRMTPDEALCYHPPPGDAQFEHLETGTPLKGTWNSMLPMRLAMCSFGQVDQLEEPPACPKRSGTLGMRGRNAFFTSLNTSPA